jgi:hypothetical protein
MISDNHIGGGSDVARQAWMRTAAAAAAAAAVTPAVAVNADKSKQIMPGFRCHCSL